LGGGVGRSSRRSWSMLAARTRCGSGAGVLTYGPPTHSLTRRPGPDNGRSVPAREL
jgi:hypothetical protein